MIKKEHGYLIEESRPHISFMEFLGEARARDPAVA
jgi:hypothetical protein